MFRKLLALLSDSAVYGISSMLSQVIGFVLLPLYTRYLSPTDYGTLAMLTVIGMVMAPVRQLGIPNAIFRRFNVDKDPAARARVLTTGLVSVTVSGLVLLVVTLALSVPIAKYVIKDESAASLLQLSFVASTFGSIGMVPQTVLRAQRRVKTAAAVNVLQLLVTVLVTIWLVVYRQMGLWGVVTGSFIGALTFLAVQFGLTLRQFITIPSWDEWKKMVHYGLPLVPHRIQGVGLAMFGQYMVNEMAGTEQAGLYYMAAKFALPVTFVVNAIQNSWVPYKFQIHAEDDNPKEFFRTAVTYYAAGILYLWVGVAVWGPDMLRLMTTSGFHPAAYLVPLVALIPVGQGMYFMMGTGMELTDNTRLYPLVSLTGLITLVISAMILVSWIGAPGAALATVIAWAVTATVIWYLSQRYFPVSYDWRILGSLALIALAAVALGYASQSLPLVVRLPILLSLSLAMPALEFLILARSESERRRMQLLTKRVREQIGKRRQARATKVAAATSPEATTPTATVETQTESQLAESGTPRSQS